MSDPELQAGLQNPNSFHLSLRSFLTRLGAFMSDPELQAGLQNPKSKLIPSLASLVLL